jgi:hypothetical protein
MQAGAAETLALRALQWAAADGKALAEFLAVSGLGVEDLRARAGETELLAAFLDFVLADDARIGAVCEAAECNPEALHQARRALPGATLD